MARPVKPSQLSEEELEAEVKRLLVVALARRSRPLRRRWVRSAITDAICSAGPGWRPNQPFTDLMRENRRREREVI